MPLYLYRCLKCGREKEEIRTIAERDDVPCCVHHNQTNPGLSEIINMPRVQAAPGFRIKGFSEVNGYNRTDTGYQPSQFPGIKTRVHDAEDK